jgi:hypothetical protein
MLVSCRAEGPREYSLDECCGLHSPLLHSPLMHCKATCTDVLPRAHKPSAAPSPAVSVYLNDGDKESDFKIRGNFRCDNMLRAV